MSLDDLLHRPADRQVHLQGFGARHHGRAAGHAFGHVPQLGQNIGQRMPLGQHQPHPTVAGEIARAGQHQIAHAGKAQEGLGLGTLRQTEAGDFGQTAREQRRTGVETQPQTVADAGGHGHDVLECPAHLHPDDVGAAVGTQRAVMEGAHHLVSQCRVTGRSGERRRQAGRHFLRKARTAQAADGAARQRIGQHLMGQPARSGLQPLGKADDAGQGQGTEGIGG